MRITNTFLGFSASLLLLSPPTLHAQQSYGSYFGQHHHHILHHGVLEGYVVGYAHHHGYSGVAISATRPRGADVGNAEPIAFLLLSGHETARLSLGSPVSVRAAGTGETYRYKTRLGAMRGLPVYQPILQYRQ